MSVASTHIDDLAIDTIRTLSMDAVQTANSGHPGTPMALAPVAYQLFNQTMNYDPAQPWWPNRDRFVLSCGHASMLLYSVLHLAQVKATDKSGNVLDELAIKLDDIKNFRQIGSPCAGHPEYGEAAGIETTTGPLGAGCSNSVGMAMSQKWLAANYNTADHKLFDFNVYALCSDGDLMEGVACEAASIAGHLKLDNLCWIYDDNQHHDRRRHRSVVQRRRRQTIRRLGLECAECRRRQRCRPLAKAIAAFQACHDKPTIIIVRKRSSAGELPTNKTRTTPTVPRWVGTKSNWPKRTTGFRQGRKILHPRWCDRTLCQQYRHPRGGRLRRLGGNLDAPTKSQPGKSGRIASDVSTIGSPMVGTRTSRYSRRAKKAMRRETAAAKCSTRSPRTSPS